MLPRQNAQHERSSSDCLLWACTTKKRPSCRLGWIAFYMVVQSLALIAFHLDSYDGVDNAGTAAATTVMLQEFVKDGPQTARTHQQHQPVVGTSMSAEEIEATRAYVESFKTLDRPLIFFHIPKTAGTAIEYAAGKQDIPWGSCLFNHKPKRDICKYPSEVEWPRHVGWWHLPSQLFPLAHINPYQGAELFGVIRNPYDRLVSEYYYTCTLKVFAWRPDQCKRERLFEKAYMNEWLQDKLSDRDTDPALAYLTDNGHFTPQYDFVFGPNDVRMLDHVLMLDDTLPDQFSRLMTRFSLPHVELEKRNALGAQARDSDEHLTVGDLDEKTVKAIHESYPHDFDLGYSKIKTVS